MKHYLLAGMWIVLFGVDVYLIDSIPIGGWWSVVHCANGLSMVACIFMFADSIPKGYLSIRKKREAFLRKILVAIGSEEAKEYLSYAQCEKLFTIVTSDLLYPEREVMLAFYGKYNGDTIRFYAMVDELGMETIEAQELLLIVFEKMTKQLATYQEFNL